MPEGQFDGTIRGLADQVRGPWAQVAAVWDEFRSRHGFHLRADTGTNDQLGFLAEALNAARGRGLLGKLAAALLQAELVEEGFAEALTATLPDSRFELQAVQNGVFRMRNALLAFTRGGRACEQVCRIDIDGQQMGTGVLLRPTLVATAAHVLLTLLEPDAAGQLVARADGLRRLVLTFGDAEDFLPDDAGTFRRPGEVAALHERWLAWVSEPSRIEHPRLADVRDITDLTVPEGPWDLALIRLARPVREGLFGARLLTREPPHLPFEVHVLHHPNGGTANGQPLLWSIGVLDGRLGDPLVRCLHTADTAPGSSGAPVFDRDFRVVALHQGGLRVLDAGNRSREAADDASRNRAVPILHWLGKLDELERTAGPAPLLSELQDRPERQPVIGRQESQRRIRLALPEDAPVEQRLLVVRGKPGSGRRFTARLVRALAVPPRHVVAELDMRSALDADIEGFAARLAGALGAAAPEPERAHLTTRLRSAREALLPDLLAVIAQAAGADGAVWLVLEGFDEADLSQAPGALALIEELIARLDQAPRLRLVLIGWQATLPARFAQCAEELRPPVLADVVDHIVYRLAPPGDDGARVRPFLQAFVARKAGHVDLGRADAYPALRAVLRDLSPELDLLRAAAGRAA